MALHSFLFSTMDIVKAVNTKSREGYIRQIKLIHLPGKWKPDCLFLSLD